MYIYMWIKKHIGDVAPAPKSIILLQGNYNVFDQLLTYIHIYLIIYLHFLVKAPYCFSVMNILNLSSHLGLVKTHYFHGAVGREF